MISRILLIIFVFFASSATSSGNFESGNTLYEDCDGNDYDQILCLGYLRAISDVLNGDNTVNGFKACIPAGVTPFQLKSILIKWLDDNPENRHYAAAGLVASSFQEAFPCD